MAFANSHRRRQVVKRVLAEESHCALCGQPVDKSIPTPEPLSPEVDEILPVARGGSPYNRDNCQLTHRVCNRHKWHHLEEELEQRLALPGDEYETDRAWW